MKRFFLKKIIGLVAVSFVTLVQPTQSAEILPIDAFAMREGIKQVSLSPNGKYLGLLRAQSMDGQYKLEVYETTNLSKKPISFGAEIMEMQGFYWLNDDRLWVSFRQKANRGQSKWRYASAIVNRNGKGRWTDVPDGGQASILALLRDKPNEILLQYDDNDNGIPDVVRYNVKTGRSRTIFRGTSKFFRGFGVDADGDVRLAGSFDLGDTALEYYGRRKGETDWILLGKNSAHNRESFEVIGLNPDNGDEVFVLTNNGEDKAAIYAMDMTTQKFTEKLFAVKSVDAGGIITSRKPGSIGRLQGFYYATSKFKNVYINPVEKALDEAIQGLFPEHDATASSRSNDDNAIVIHVGGARDAGSYYLLRNKSNLTFIGSSFPLIKSEDLSPVKYISYKARDGLKIPAYLTIPKGEGPFPTVVMPHGGPWARDEPGYDEWSQLLAHYGYLILRPEFRGSEGFGLAHWKAGDRNWGLSMQDDLDDGMAYLIENGLADKNRLAMFGWSYGGYAAFVGSMRDNNIYKCTIAGAGVSDMSRISANIFDSYFSRKLQRPTVAGVSPLDQVEKVNVPILVIHGDIDQRVPVSHSRDFVKKLQELGKDYKYVELEGADHFSNTLYYEHKKRLYTELLDWLKNKCFPQ